MRSAPRSSSAPETDGRRLRAEASRERIVRALIALVQEGELAPSAEAVAERAGVGLRTVFRLFNDMETLHREMQAVMIGRIAPLFDQPLEGGWRERIDGLIERRRRIFEEILPLKSAGEAFRVRSSLIQAEHMRMTRMTREMLLFLLPESVRADLPLVDALDLALSFEGWRRLRQEQDLTPDQAEAVVRRLVSGLLDR